MMCASTHCATIVSSYNPSNASDETDIITFNNKLSFLVRHIRKQNFLIIARGMNAEIGKDENNKFY